MTFKEFLQKTPFDSIIEPLKDRDDGCGIREYKEAYDEICRQPDKQRDKRITIYMETEYDGSTYMTADDCEGDTLESNANKELKMDIPDGYNNAKVCAALLWHVTFYGYTARVTKRYSDKWLRPHDCPNDYEKQARKLYGKARALYIPKHLRKNFIDRQALEVGQWKAYDKRKSRRNGPKRKRGHRMETRVDFLYRQGLRKRAIDWLEAKPDGPNPLCLPSQPSQEVIKHKFLEQV